MRPSTTATLTGSSPEPASAGVSAVPMTPKQADCSAETAQMSGTERLGFSFDGASAFMADAALVPCGRPRPRPERPGVAGKANDVAVCKSA